MKKTLTIVGALLVGSLSAYSQGEINFANRVSDITVHIFAPQLLTPTVETTGDQGLATGAAVGGVTADLYANNGADLNYAGGSVQGAGVSGTITTGGTAVYTGGAIGNTASGFATPAGAYSYNNGSDYTVQLWAAPGLNAAASALQPVTQYTSIIYTSATLGGAFKNVNPASDPGIPGASTSATIALVCWYNAGGTITSYTAAQGVVPTGMSPLDNVTGLYVSGAGTPPTPEGLESFSLTSPIPEPSTIALGVIGVSTLLFRRRK